MEMETLSLLYLVCSIALLAASVVYERQIGHSAQSSLVNTTISTNYVPKTDTAAARGAARGAARNAARNALVDNSVTDNSVTDNRGAARNAITDDSASTSASTTASTTAQQQNDASSDPSTSAPATPQADPTDRNNAQATQAKSSSSAPKERIHDPLQPLVILAPSESDPNSCDRINPNSRQPYVFENDYFKTKILMMFR
jgi:hypothetical protein